MELVFSTQILTANIICYSLLVGVILRLNSSRSTKVLSKSSLTLMLIVLRVLQKHFAGCQNGLLSALSTKLDEQQESHLIKLLKTSRLCFQASLDFSNLISTLHSHLILQMEKLMNGYQEPINQRLQLSSSHRKSKLQQKKGACQHYLVVLQEQLEEVIVHLYKLKLTICKSSLIFWQKRTKKTPKRNPHQGTGIFVVQPPQSAICFLIAE